MRFFRLACNCLKYSEPRLAIFFPPFRPRATAAGSFSLAKTHRPNCDSIMPYARAVATLMDDFPVCWNERGITQELLRFWKLPAPETLPVWGDRDPLIVSGSRDQSLFGRQACLDLDSV